MAKVAPEMASWTSWAPLIIAATVTGLLGLLSGIWLKRMNRPVDNATVLKTHVEAERLRAETDKIRVESEGKEVEIARGLLDDIRKELDRYRMEMERDRQRHAEQVTELTEQNEKRYAEVALQLGQVQSEQQVVRQQLDIHLPWDEQVHELARQVDPEFPTPPPLGGRSNHRPSRR